MPLALSPQDRQDLGLTIAGEIDSRFSPYGTEATRQEMAAIMGVVENRSMLSNKSISQTVKEKSQFSTWNDTKGRKNAQANYAANKAVIDAAIAEYEAGSLVSPVPDATHYWSPIGMMAITNNQRAKPGWAVAIENQTTIGPHTFGTYKGMLTPLQEARMFANLNPPTPTSRPSYVDPSFATYAENAFSRTQAPTSTTGLSTSVATNHAQMAASLAAAGLIGLDGRTPYAKDNAGVTAPTSMASAERFGYTAPGLSMPSPERFGYTPQASVSVSAPAAPASRSALSMPSAERFGYTAPSAERFGYNAPARASVSGPVSAPAAAKADRLGSPAKSAAQSSSSKSAPASMPSAERFGYTAEPSAARFGYDMTAKSMAASPSGPVSSPAAAKADRLGMPSAPSNPAAGYVDKSVNPSNPGQLGGVTMSNPVGLGGPGGLYVGAPPSQPGMPAAPAKAAVTAPAAPSVTISAPAAPKAAVAPPSVDRSTRTASTPAAPRASAMDVYSGKAMQALDNTGKNTVTRDKLGNISVTNSYGVTTTTSPQGFSTVSRGMPAAPTQDQEESQSKTASSGLSLSGLSKGIGGKITSGIKGLDTPQAKGAIAGALLGGLLGGVPGAVAGARLGSGMGKKFGTVQYDTMFGKISAAAPRGGYGFPSAPTGTAGALGGKQSNNSAEGMRGISPGAAAAIDKGQGGLY